MITTVDLLAAIGAHLDAFELPAVASVEVVASAAAAQQMSVQLACPKPAGLARGLLAWADTLTEITAQAWRVPRGDSVHFSVTGRLPGGAWVLVYGGLSVSNGGLGADLTPGATTTIPLAALRQAAIVEEASAR